MARNFVANGRSSRTRTRYRPLELPQSGVASLLPLGLLCWLAGLRFIDSPSRRLFDVPLISLVVTVFDWPVLRAFLLGYLPTNVS